MKTLNEQIQRLRDVLHTCYESIARKGGTLPPVGERNMTNLPDAVESVPQEIVAELEELTITANGEYTPQEGVDGFSKVVAEFDTSSLPKVKVYRFLVGNACLDENGRWSDNNLIDYSAITTLESAFIGCGLLKKIDVKNWQFISAPNVSLFDTFRMCRNLVDIENFEKASFSVSSLRRTFQDTAVKILHVENLDTINSRDCQDTFAYNNVLEWLDLRKWKFNETGLIDGIFYLCRKLYTTIGDTTLEDVINNNISCFAGINKNLDLHWTILERASLRAFINGLADLTGQTAQTLTLGDTLMAKLTEEDIAIAVSKNWTIV
jgi:hypothetical protein